MWVGEFCPCTGVGCFSPPPAAAVGSTRASPPNKRAPPFPLIWGSHLELVGYFWDGRPSLPLPSAARWPRSGRDVAGALDSGEHSPWEQADSRACLSVGGCWVCSLRVVCREATLRVLCLAAGPSPPGTPRGRSMSLRYAARCVRLPSFAAHHASLSLCSPRPRRLHRASKAPWVGTVSFTCPRVSGACPFTPRSRGLSFLLLLSPFH